MNTYWTYARRMLRYRATLVGALCCAALSATGLGVGLVGIGPILDNILGRQRNLQDILRDLDADIAIIPESVIEAMPTDVFTGVVIVMVLLGFLTVFGGLANFLHNYLAITVVQRTVTNIRREMFHRVVRLPLKVVVAGGSMDAISRIVNDANALGAGFNALISKAVAQVTKGVAALIAALVIDWRLTCISLLVAPVLYTVIRRLGKRIRRASRKALQSHAGLYGSAAEAIQGLRVVKVHTTERYEAGRFHRINKEAMRQMLRVRTARAVASPLVEVLAIFVLGFLSLIATKAILDQKLDPTDFILALSALGIAGASLKPLTGLINDIQQSAGAAERIDELMQSEPEPGHDKKLPKLPRHGHSIAFENVHFAYPGAEARALDEVDLEITHGETVAVVGPNGSGKTTLLALVPRLFEPDQGRVLVDGQDIRDYGVRSLRSQIGVVTQETILFRGTIRSNIAYGAGSVTEEEIKDAARRARAADFIDRLSDGYDTVVGEQGLTLSGGQRQRIAIARAILRDPAILILDEATSMVDADSEAQIAEAISDFGEGRTCLIVAHRLSTVLNADRIIVMNEGRVADIGTHQDLLERCETYKLIASRQLVSL